MKLLLVDFSNLWRMNWHASEASEVSSAYEKTISKVRWLSGQHDRTVICLDSPPYDRKKLSPTYKEGREPPTPVMIEQGRRAIERLQADGHLVWRVKGAESDDIFASTVAWCLLNAVGEILLCSSDKDTLQLVDDDAKVSQYSFAADKTFRAADVIAKFGVHPRDMGDFLALCGDKSDGIAGCPGCGPVTAAKWLAEQGTLESLLAAAEADKLGTTKVAAALKANVDQVRLARRLVTLDTSLALPFADIHKAAEVKPLNKASDFPAESPEEDQDMTDEDVEGIISGPPQKQEALTPAQAQEPPKSAPRAVEPAPIEKAEDAKKNGGPPAEKATSAIIPAPQEWSMQLEPRASAGAWWLAQKLEDSRMYPQFGNAAGIYAMLLRGRALGLDATTALASFHNIKGKIAMHADLIEALVLRSGKAEYFDCVETTSRKAVYETKRKGARNKLRIEFTIEDAWAADLVTKDQRGMDGFRGVGDKGPSNWDKYRATMLRHRCKTQLARAVYADVVLGLYMPEELGEQGVMDAEFEEVA